MSEPRPSSGQTSQLLRGHRADVLERDGGWLRLLGADRYEGWCHEGYITALATGAPLESAWSTQQRISLGCTIRTARGAHLALPLGALLDQDDEVTGGKAMNQRARAAHFQPTAAAIATRGAELFVGVPYQWGGVTTWGADCSGFVQTSHALHGVSLPRDAWMQSECGREVSGDPTELLPADLLFFSDRANGRITHVALSLGGTRLAHVSLANGGFGVNDLAADDAVALGLRKTFRFARRVV